MDVRNGDDARRERRTGEFFSYTLVYICIYNIYNMVYKIDVPYIYICISTRKNPDRFETSIKIATLSFSSLFLSFLLKHRYSLLPLISLSLSLCSGSRGDAVRATRAARSWFPVLDLLGPSNSYEAGRLVSSRFRDRDRLVLIPRLKRKRLQFNGDRFAPR